MTVGNFTGPATKATEVTPADSDIASPYRAVYVGVTGDLSVRLVNDSADVTFVAVPAGSLLPISVIRINAATTAGSIVGLR